MDSVSIRDLRNHGGDVVDRVSRGESVTVTRDGKPVAQIRPLRAPALSGRALLDHWHRLPALDPMKLRADVDAATDAAL